MRTHRSVAQLESFSLLLSLACVWVYVNMLTAKMEKEWIEYDLCYALCCVVYLCPYECEKQRWRWQSDKNIDILEINTRLWIKYESVRVRYRLSWMIFY